MLFYFQEWEFKFRPIFVRYGTLNQHSTILTHTNTIDFLSLFARETCWYSIYMLKSLFCFKRISHNERVERNYVVLSLKSLITTTSFSISSQFPIEPILLIVELNPPNTTNTRECTSCLNQSLPVKILLSQLHYVVSQFKGKRQVECVCGILTFRYENTHYNHDPNSFESISFQFLNWGDMEYVLGSFNAKGGLL